MSPEAKLEKFIAQSVPYGSEFRKIDLDEELIGGGLLDSIALLQLIFFIEEQFGVSVEGEEITTGNFRTINSIKAFIESKKRVSAA